MAFCEIEEFPRKVLAKHWPGVPIYEDVRELTAARLAADGIAVDVICGGFPCQDVSLAGKRAGLEGERSGLWGEYRRLIGELRPRFALIENVPGLLSAGAGTVLRDLAALRYDALWECIPASAAGAHHLRDRVWIVGVDAEPSRVEDGATKPLTHTDAARQPHYQGRAGPPEQDRGKIITADAVGSWLLGWIPEPKVGRVVHGLSADVDAIAALGNAVVPQIPELIGKAILEAERTSMRGNA